MSIDSVSLKQKYTSLQLTGLMVKELGSGLKSPTATIPWMWKQSFRDVPDAFLLRGCIIVNTSYLGCWGPLFEWWQLGDVNPVRWNSYTDLHLNLAKKRFKINVFTCAICGLRCELSSQVHSDWTRLLHMLIDVWFSTAQENPSLFSFHCFRLITFLPRSYIPQYWKFTALLARSL